MKKQYSYTVNDTDPNRYDIFEVGGKIVAKSVTFDLVSKIVRYLNSNTK